MIRFCKTKVLYDCSKLSKCGMILQFPGSSSIPAKCSSATRKEAPLLESIRLGCPEVSFPTSLANFTNLLYPLKILPAFGDLTALGSPITIFRGCISSSSLIVPFFAIVGISNAPYRRLFGPISFRSFSTLALESRLRRISGSNWRSQEEKV
jgi:hypothetical protein